MSSNGKSLALPDSSQGPRGRDGRMDTAIERREGAAPGIDWQEIKRVVAAAIQARILPKSITSEDQAVAIALKARELGVPPMQGFSSIHLIQGVASCSANLMLALAYKHLPRFDMKVHERTPARCKIEFRRDPDRSWIPVTYTIEEARAAGLAGKDNWKNHPAAMLTARVIGIGCRLVAPDVFTGLYAVEEMEAGFPPEAGDDLVPVEVPAPVRVESSVVASPPARPSSREIDGMRRDLSIAAKESPLLIKTAMDDLGIKPPRKWSEMSEADVERLHAYATGPKEAPAPPLATVPAGSPEEKAFDDSIPF